MIEIMLSELQRGYLRSFFQGRERSLVAVLTRAKALAPEREAAEIITALCGGTFEVGVEAELEPEPEPGAESPPSGVTDTPTPPQPPAPPDAEPLKHDWVKSEELDWLVGEAPADGKLMACRGCRCFWGEAPAGPCILPGPTIGNPLDTL